MTLGYGHETLLHSGQELCKESSKFLPAVKGYGLITSHMFFFCTVT